jgi:hypothetical protein
MLHLLEQYRRTTSVAYPPAVAVDTLLTRLNLSPGSYAADKVYYAGRRLYLLSQRC